MKTQQLPPATYAERATAMKAESSKAEFKQIAEVYKLFDKAAKGLEENAVASANLARELGIHLQTLCGHEQIDFAFWQQRCNGKLPFDFNSAKMFVAIARKMPAKAKTLAEAVQFVQMVLVADNALQLPERAESQTKSTVSIVEKFFCEFTLIRQPWQKIIRSRPMEQWEPTALDKFLSETQWLADEREKAAKLRAK